MKRFVSMILSMMLILISVFGIAGNAAAEQKVTQVTTGARGASLRNWPDGEKIGSVHRNTCLDVLEQQNGWFYVYYLGQFGWVSSTVVTITGVETVGSGGNDSTSSEGRTNGRNTDGRNTV